eukprot:Gb_41378 [translate_table: standard]
MQPQRRMRTLSDEISDEALECVMGHLEDPRDRSAVSLVCKKWYRVDALTRKHITIAFCYSINPSDLSKRFPRLESLKLKGKPRAAMFNLIPPDWGGYAEPWVNEISETFLCLKAVHFRRMIVTDDDLRTLVRGRGHMLQSLKLEKCSGFSTLGLLEVTRHCRVTNRRARNNRSHRVVWSGRNRRHGHMDMKAQAGNYGMTGLMDQFSLVGVDVMRSARVWQRGGNGTSRSLVLQNGGFCDGIFTWFSSPPLCRFEDSRWIGFHCFAEPPLLYSLESLFMIKGAIKLLFQACSIVDTMIWLG